MSWLVWSSGIGCVYVCVLTSYYEKKRLDRFGATNTLHKLHYIYSSHLHSWENLIHTEPKLQKTSSCCLSSPCSCLSMHIYAIKALKKFNSLCVWRSSSKKNDFFYLWTEFNEDPMISPHLYFCCFCHFSWYDNFSCCCFFFKIILLKSPMADSGCQLINDYKMYACVCVCDWFTRASKGNIWIIPMWHFRDQSEMKTSEREKNMAVVVFLSFSHIHANKIPF